MTPVTGVGFPLAALQSAATGANGGVPAFIGATALVLTGFLVLARLSQRVVDDVGDAPAAASAGEARDVSPADGSHDAPPAEGERGPVPAEEARDAPPAAEERDTPPAEDERGAPPAEADREPVSVGADPDAPPADGERTDRLSADGAPGQVRSGRGRFDGPGVDASPAARSVREPPSMESLSPAALLANVALTQGLFGGVLAAAAWFFQVPGAALGLSGGRVEGLAAVGVGLAFGAVLWVGNELAGALADAAGAAYDEGLRRALAPTDARGWAVLLGGVLPVIALVEEFLFRAAAVGAASSLAGGAWALAAVSSLAFALGHGAQGRAGVAVTGALGFVLAAGFVLSGSFLVVVVAHYVVNALEFLVHEWLGLPDPIWS